MLFCRRFGGGAPPPEASEMIKILVDINGNLKTFENFHALLANQFHRAWELSRAWGVGVWDCIKPCFHINMSNNIRPNCFNKTTRQPATLGNVKFSSKLIFLNFPGCDLLTAVIKNSKTSLIHLQFLTNFSQMRN